MARISAADRNLALQLAKDDKLTAAEVKRLEARGFTHAEIQDIKRQAKDGAGLTRNELREVVPPAGKAAPEAAKAGAAEAAPAPAPAAAPAGGTTPDPAPAADAKISAADRKLAERLGAGGLTAAEKKKLATKGFSKAQITNLVGQAKDGGKLTANEVLASTQTADQRQAARAKERAAARASEARQEALEKQLSSKKLSAAERQLAEQRLRAEERREKRIAQTTQRRDAQRTDVSYEARKAEIAAELEGKPDSVRAAELRREQARADIRQKIYDSKGERREQYRKQYMQLVEKQLGADNLGAEEKAQIQQLGRNITLRNQIRDPETAKARKADLREKLSEGNRVARLQTSLRQQQDLSPDRRAQIGAEVESFARLTQLRKALSSSKSTAEQKTAAKAGIAAIEAAQRQREGYRNKYKDVSPAGRKALEDGVRSAQAAELRRKQLINATKSGGGAELASLLKSESAEETNRYRLRSQLVAPGLTAEKRAAIVSKLEASEAASAMRVAAALKKAGAAPAAGTQHQTAPVEAEPTDEQIDAETDNEVWNDPQIPGDAEGGLPIEGTENNAGQGSSNVDKKALRKELKDLDKDILEGSKAMLKLYKQIDASPNMSGMINDEIDRLRSENEQLNARRAQIIEQLGGIGAANAND